MAPKISKTELRFDSICKEIDVFSENVNKCSVEQQVRISVLKTKLKDYEHSISEIFANFSQKENDDNVDKYLRYKDKVLNLLVSLEEKTKLGKNSENDTGSKSKQISVKLPKFDLPHFYGDSEHWISFKELFESTIVQNEQLSEIEKLQYLHSAVRGNASKLIRGFALREENLKNCWEILCERYENKRQLAICQINKIFNTKIVKANNSKTLLELIDTCNEAVRNLQTLGLESNSLSDLMIINCMISKLDEPLKQRWELMQENDKIPNLDLFKKFIEREARSMSENKTTKLDTKFRPAYKVLDNNVGKKHLTNSALVKKSNNDVVSNNVCIICSQTHALYKCLKFNSMPVMERWKIVETNKLCQNCLRKNHKLENCRINFSCKNCDERHHTLLHVYSVNKGTSEVCGSSSPEMLVSNSAQCLSSNVLLSTALINVKNRDGKVIQCRALIDNASQNSLITRECATRLDLPSRSTSHSLVGINCIMAETSLCRTEFYFTPHFSDDSHSVKAFVVERVTSPLPNFHLRQHNWPHTKYLLLADPQFYIKKEIDILLGADIFALLIEGAPIVGLPGTPVALPTKLGWVLSGPINYAAQEQSVVSCVSTVNINDTLKKFFELESVTESEILKSEDHEVETIYAETVTRDKTSGRYTVKLPFKRTVSLGESKVQAHKRFYLLEEKLKRDKVLREPYISFMEEYAKLGHMSPVRSEESRTQNYYYLPHHAVINENSSTTRLRVVFDASAKTSNGNSLNDVLLKGPKLQANIFAILVKFRCHSIAFSADIAKMYRQINVTKEDRKYQRIVWRKNPRDSIQIFELNTVTYGASCAPYLALRTVKQLCEDEKENFPIAYEVAKNHFYMDDLLAGADSVTEAQELVREMQNLMQSGGFELRKWCSNDAEALAQLPDSLKVQNSEHLFKDSFQKVLGVVWNVQNDLLRVRIVEGEDTDTKRKLLSFIARTFDPLGILSPATIILKFLLQELWQAKLEWDDHLPEEIKDKCNRFKREIQHFKRVKLPRHLGLTSNTKFELHGFCDASCKAYAAVVYLRILSDPIEIHLIAAKTRVAPVKSVTLPRLELCGALLLAELTHAIIQALNRNIENIFLWTDSTIALSWLNNHPAKGNQFVTHRVQKILVLSSVESWRHVPGKANPADCATRGLYPEQLERNQEWWYGPDWLYERTEFHSSKLPVSQIDSHVAEEPEEVQQISLVTQMNEMCNLLTKFSTFAKLIRVVAWVQRFIKGVKKLTKVKGPLNSAEIEDATLCVIKLIQNSNFQEEIALLLKGKVLPRNNKCISLNPFLDSNGILRVGGRLSRHESLAYDRKFPILLPKNHFITALIIREYHKRSMHSGTNLTLSLIRQKFWIPDGRSTVRKELRNCIACFRLNAKPTQQLMGDLPPSRIHRARPFERVGTDFAGPIPTKCEHKRKSRTFKSYICLFICMCTKAVHLEAVSDLSTAAFIAAMRRFVARRGLPSDVFSDNGKNFIGANSYLKKLFHIVADSQVQDAFAPSIRWHFIPPYAPNFGGLWEASIKLSKTHIAKSTKGALLTFEELSTILCQVEACINSRPLVPLSSDPSDFRALTPGHFLIGTPLLELPEKSEFNSSVLSISSRYKLLLQIKETFWRRWSRDYLHSLQSRPKWRTQRDIRVGDLVIIKDVSLPPLKWSLGRILQTYPGPDELTRVVKLLTSTGTMTRPISQICILPGSMAAREDVDSPVETEQKRQAVGSVASKKKNKP